MLRFELPFGAVVQAALCPCFQVHVHFLLLSATLRVVSGQVEVLDVTLWSKKQLPHLLKNMF